MDVGFLTDAGTPSISDPGWRVVDSILKGGFEVIPLAGPSAVTTACPCVIFLQLHLRSLDFWIEKKENEKNKCKRCCRKIMRMFFLNLLIEFKEHAGIWLNLTLNDSRSGDEK